MRSMTDEGFPPAIPPSPGSDVRRVDASLPAGVEPEINFEEFS